MIKRDVWPRQDIRSSEQVSSQYQLIYTTIPSVSNLLQFYCSLNKILLSLVLYETMYCENRNSAN